MKTKLSNNEIMDLIIAGKSCKEVAAELDLTRPQVEKRIKRLRKKYCCSSIAQLAAKWVRMENGDKFDP